jgi:hypothetical protein
MTIHELTITQAPPIVLQNGPIMHGCINPQVLAGISPLFVCLFVGWLL